MTLSCRPTAPCHQKCAPPPRSAATACCRSQRRGAPPMRAWWATAGSKARGKPAPKFGIANCRAPGTSVLRRLSRMLAATDLAAHRRGPPVPSDAGCSADALDTSRDGEEAALPRTRLLTCCSRVKYPTVRLHCQFLPFSTFNHPSTRPLAMPGPLQACQRSSLAGRSCTQHVPQGSQQLRQQSPCMWRGQCLRQTGQQRWAVARRRRALGRAAASLTSRSPPSCWQAQGGCCRAARGNCRARSAGYLVLMSCCRAAHSACKVRSAGCQVQASCCRAAHSSCRVHSVGCSRR
jgi:hypothetical protein